MPRMKILNSVEREVFDFPPIFNSVEHKRQVSGFGRNQAPKTDRLNQVPSWEFRNRRKSFTPRQLARILWDFTYLCWANPIFCVRHPHIWGEGTTAYASDSKKFGAWDQNLMTELHVRYGGRGVMIY